MDATTTEAVHELVRTFMRNWLDDVPDPAEQELEGLLAPFHDALVPGIRLLNERSFSTRLGNLHERVAKVIAAEVHADVRQARTHAGAQHFFEIKSGKPNKGQCIEMKERLLTAFAVRRHEDSYWWWGIPYSPYGSAPYGHNYALPFFDFENEVKTGRQFWDFLGGEGTYGQVLAIYEEVGELFASEIEALRER